MPLTDISCTYIYFFLTHNLMVDLLVPANSFLSVTPLNILEDFTTCKSLVSISPSLVTACVLFRSRIPRGLILKTATVLYVPDNKFSFAKDNLYSHCNRVV
jgi:hypothetical protein